MATTNGGPGGILPPVGGGSVVPAAVSTLAAASAEGEDGAPSAKRSRISREAKAELLNYFNGPPKWARNKKLPKLNGDKDLDKIIERHSLNRSQASRQLRNWKGIKYANSQVKLVLEPDDVELAIVESLSVDNWKDFVVDFLDDMYHERAILGSVDATNLCQTIRLCPAGYITALKFLVDSLHHPCYDILVKFMEDLTKIAGELFPKSAAELATKELQFMTRVEALKGVLVKEWMGNHRYCSSDTVLLTEIEFGYFGVFLFNCLYKVWSRLLGDDEQSTVEIPSDDLVHKYSLPVLYYVAGWVLQRTSLSLTVKEDNRGIYNLFAMSHSITNQAANEASLPCSLVEVRQKKKLFFASSDFFKFIRLVESIYIHNLTLKMMMAHSNGDLVTAINETISKSDMVRSKFFALCEQVVGIEEESDRLAIMEYILERYVHMRGCWFVKHMKNNQRKSVGETKAAAAPTRARCAQKHVESKSIAKALSSKATTSGDQACALQSTASAKVDTPAVDNDNAVKELWKSAGEQVVEYEDEEDTATDTVADYMYEESDEDSI